MHWSVFALLFLLYAIIIIVIIVQSTNKEEDNKEPITRTRLEIKFDEDVAKHKKLFPKSYEDNPSSAGPAEFVLDWLPINGINNTTTQFTTANATSIILQPSIQVQGNISDTTFTVTSAPTGVISIGMMLSNSPSSAEVIAPGTKIVDYITGTGGVGTYLINISQTVNNIKPIIVMDEIFVSQKISISNADNTSQQIFRVQFIQFVDSGLLAWYTLSLGDKDNSTISSTWNGPINTPMFLYKWSFIPDILTDPPSPNTTPDEAMRSKHGIQSSLLSKEKRKALGIPDAVGKNTDTSEAFATMLGADKTGDQLTNTIDDLYPFFSGTLTEADKFSFIYNVGILALNCAMVVGKFGFFIGPLNSFAAFGLNQILNATTPQPQIGRAHV